MPDVNELINALRELFYGKCNSDKRLQSIAQKLAEGTYSDAHDYSVRVGELLSEAFSEVLTEEIYPELTQEIARQIIPSLLGSDHRMISDACVTVQEHLNQNAGIGLKAIEPEFDVSRAYDLADKYVSYDDHEKAKWVLGEPVENYSQSVVDDSIRRNADFQWRAGMSPKIIRKAEPAGTRTIKRGNKTYTYPVPCEWCKDREGTYNYADVREAGNDVYRRHENCRCEVTYDPGNGKKQNVWSKRYIDEEGNIFRIKKLNESEKELNKVAIEKKIIRLNHSQSGDNSNSLFVRKNWDTPPTKREMLQRMKDGKNNPENGGYIAEKVLNGEFSLKYKIQKYLQHIKESIKYEEACEGRGRPQSYLTISLEEAIRIVHEYAGTGDNRNDKNGYTNSEFVSVDSIIGYYYIKDGDIWKSFPTNRVQIIHASGGVHIVPVKPKEE